MSLTTAQQAILATDINSAANAGALGAFITAADWPSIANFYNAASATQVWIPNLPVTIVLAATNWTTFAIKTALQQSTYIAMTSQPTLDATNVNYRNGFAAVFSGVDLTVLSNIAQRVATRLEALFGSGGPPITSTLFGVTLGPGDVQQALGH
jgi:hypothetical protein